MLLQVLVVAVLVAACTGYAAWTLMPASLRRGLAVALLELPLPGVVAAALQRRAQASSSGCACDGCDKSKAAIDAMPASKPALDGVAPLVFHPRSRL